MNRAEPIPSPRDDDKRTIRSSLGGEPPVNLRLHSLHPDPALEAYVRSRVDTKLGKYVRNLSRVSVRFDDVNGPKSGRDARCRVKIVLAGLPSILIEDVGTGPRKAFDLAIDRADRAALRALRER